MGAVYDMRSTQKSLSGSHGACPFQRELCLYETQVRAIPENNSQAPLEGSWELKLSLDFFTLGACPVSHPVRP